MQLQANECIAFEDSWNGLQASRAAGLATVITPTQYTATHDFSGAMRLVPDMSHLDVTRLRAWHNAYLN
jgi:beta-phosphoglucomutase-like phosphatase (HAD superfamily)